MPIEIVQPQKHLDLKKGSVLGGVLLISGSCIGVGMLALPVLTAFSGFLPTIVVFILCWLFMTTTALLLVEANMWYEDRPNLVTLSYRTLGRFGQICTWICYLFLFYSLIVAYIVKGGELIQHSLEGYFPFLIPTWVGSSLITILSALLIYSGTWFVDYFNRVSMLGLFFTYFCLLFVGIPYFEAKYLTHIDWTYFFFILPFIITSFGFHNMIPTLNEYLEGDEKKLLTTVILGGLIPFVIFILWIVKVQSIVPLKGEVSLSNSFFNGEISTEVLSVFLKSSWISLVAIYFSFFAIITSLFGQALSVFDFLSDGLKISKTSKGKLILCLLTFLPAYVLSQIFPDVFFIALELVGGVAVMILFGLLPVVMVWQGRYRIHYQAKTIVPGGKPLLILIAVLAVGILFYEMIKYIW